MRGASRRTASRRRHAHHLAQQSARPPARGEVPQGEHQQQGLPGARGQRAGRYRLHVRRRLRTCPRAPASPEPGSCAAVDRQERARAAAANGYVPARQGGPRARAGTEHVAGRIRVGGVQAPRGVARARARGARGGPRRQLAHLRPCGRLAGLAPLRVVQHARGHPPLRPIHPRRAARKGDDAQHHAQSGSRSRSRARARPHAPAARAVADGTRADRQRMTRLAALDPAAF
mmetsp:Transcript_53931/g.117647  ORF Transcript_53931/g.117647 Transcript_53931/m.117647 type:complete len:231 (+) Transcript_53931:701-1393(+)